MSTPNEVDGAAEALSPIDPEQACAYRTIGSYRVERLLGKGGMGAVYLARHEAIHRRVAIKVLQATKDPEVVARFQAEARAATSIGNEHIVNVTDFAAMPDGSTYFVMEYLEGQSLAQLLHELAAVPTERLLTLALQIARALEAAHAVGIIHRDLKPDNIFVCQRHGGDFVKILDFGIAKMAQVNGPVTKAGTMLGTPNYMSPEQASGNAVDRRADIYSLGIILYEAAVGVVPFQADSFMGVLSQHMYQPPAPPRAHPKAPSGISPGLEAIIMLCLRKDPGQRYGSMSELAQDIERVQRQEVPNALRALMSMSERSIAYAKSALEAFSQQAPLPVEVTFAPSRRSSATSHPAQDALRPRWTQAEWMIVATIGVLGLVSGLLVYLIWIHTPTSAASAARAADVHAAHGALASATPAAASSAELSLAERTKVSTTLGGSARRLPVVLLASHVPEAHVFEGNADLGEMPLNVSRPFDGVSRSLVVRAPGHVEQRLTVEPGSPDKITVDLEPTSTPAAPTLSTAPARPPPSSAAPAPPPAQAAAPSARPAVASTTHKPAARLPQTGAKFNPDGLDEPWNPKHPKAPAP